MQFERPMSAPKIEPTHALMDPEAAAIVFGGHLFEGDNLFNVCKSIVKNDQQRLLAEAAMRGDVVQSPRPHGRVLVRFLDANTTLGEVAAMAASLTTAGIAHEPDWQLDERGVPYSIAIFAKEAV